MFLGIDIVLFCFVLFCFVLFCFVLFCFVLFVLFCFVLFCFVLFCFVLFCFVLFCLLFFWDCCDMVGHSGSCGGFLHVARLVRYETDYGMGKVELAYLGIVLPFGDRKPRSGGISII